FCSSLRVSYSVHCSVFVSPCHDTSALTGNRSVYCRDDTVVDVTCGTVKRDRISFVELFAVKSELLVLFVHDDVAASGYTASTHTTGNYGCVRCHTTTNCQDTLCALHTFDILWGCLKTNKDNLFSSCCPFFSIFCCEDDLTACSSR